jgi:hypothetical protein
MPKIAISYRRSDSRAIVGRIFDRLADHYGSDEIFLDIDAIPYGRNFREHIDSVLKQCKALIAVIGPHWTGARADGSPRILDEADPVRIEVQTALAQNMRILPVLIEDAIMPGPGDLPESLREFSYLNALHIDSGVDFKIHVGRLIAALDQIVGTPDGASASEAVRKHAVAPEHWPGARILLGYLILPTLAMLLAHYLIVLKLDLHFNFLRLLDIAIPAAAGFLLFWNERRSCSWAILLGAGMALLSVAGMQLVMALVAGATFMPSTMVDWQEAFEFLASIQLATVAGYLIARMASASRPHPSRQGRAIGG